MICHDAVSVAWRERGAGFTELPTNKVKVVARRDLATNKRFEYATAKEKETLPVRSVNNLALAGVLVRAIELSTNKLTKA